MRGGEGRRPAIIGVDISPKLHDVLLEHHRTRHLYGTYLFRMTGDIRIIVSLPMRLLEHRGMPCLLDEIYPLDVRVVVAPRRAR